MHRNRFAKPASRALLIALALLALATTAPLAAPSKSAASAKPSAPAAPIDVNKASQEELTALPGIGPAMAKRIVEFREEHGPFQRVEDLMKVKGIGEKSFQKLRPHVKVK